MNESAAASAFRCRKILLSFHDGDLATLQLSYQMFQILFGFIAQNSFPGQERYVAPLCVREKKTNNDKVSKGDANL